MSIEGLIEKDIRTTGVAYAKARISKYHLCHFVVNFLCPYAYFSFNADKLQLTIAYLI